MEKRNMPRPEVPTKEEFDARMAEGLRQAEKWETSTPEEVRKRLQEALDQLEKV